MKRKHKSWIAALALFLLMIVAVLGLSIMTRQMERAVTTGIVTVTVTPVPNDDDEI